MHTAQQLRSDLIALGVCPGDAILMHSSFRSLGGLEGGAGAFFETFLDLLGNDGTLVLPALSYDSVNAQQPVFDACTTPSCPGIGYLTEYFRTKVPGVIRSLHPTHSCCMAGKHAAFLAEHHHLDETPVGIHSPFAKLPQIGGWILMLGCSPDRNTSFHGVEETAEPPYLLKRTKRIRYTLRAADGTEYVQNAIPHNFVLDGKYCEQKYSRILPLLADDEVRYGKVLGADCVLMSSAAVWLRGREKLMEDPFYFVDR